MKAALGWTNWTSRGKKALSQALKEWAKLGDSKTYGEAGDTAVREVWADQYENLAALFFGSTWDQEGEKVDWETMYGKHG